MNSTCEKVLRETEGLPTDELLLYVLKAFGDKVALASSFGAEDQVLTDMLCKISPNVRIFTLDTGRLSEHTHEAIEATRGRYGIEVKVLFPERDAVERMVAEHGPNLFYSSAANRKLCCRIRKVEPLQRELATLDAWITGLRREQGTTRTDLQPVQWDQANDLIKINPLADWTTEFVWKYIRDHNVPYNTLHDRGYPSIGCAPCTRAVAAGEDIRSGRWWWEKPEQKECGLHLTDDGQLVRATDKPQ